MADTAYAVVKASARKGDLLTDQQMIDLASSKDLGELVNKLKDRYSELLKIVGSPTLEAMEKSVSESFCNEVEDFIKVFPKARNILKLIRQELEEGRAVKILVDGLMEGKKKGYSDIVVKLKQMGFDEEIKEGEKVFDKYGVPGLVASVFARFRILKLMKFLRSYGGEVSDALAEHVSLKVDEFNLSTLLRGIKNGIRRDALEELVIISGGSLRSRLIKEAAKAPDLKKALLTLGMSAYQEDPRSLERSIEKKIRSALTRAYYGNYTDLGAVVGYLELKKLEVINIIRIASCISRGIEPSRVVQDFIL